MHIYYTINKQILNKQILKLKLIKLSLPSHFLILHIIISFFCPHIKHHAKVAYLKKLKELEDMDEALQRERHRQLEKWFQEDFD